ncbi:MAG: PIN domain-containing protein [Bacteroidota bacterium]|nr:PIN domain-containing protein [Bacteroidota bacterium]
MIHVLLDTNILLNVWLHDPAKPRPMASESARILAVAADGLINTYITPSTFATTYYFLRKFTGPSKARNLATDILDCTAIIPQDEKIFRKALTGGWTDVEDAAQYEAALMWPSISMICTSDTNHYRKAIGIKVVDPAALLRMI